MDQNLTMHPRSLRAEGSKWFGLTCRLSSELSEVLHREQIAGRSAEILFESDKKGIIRIEGKIAFEITISDSNVVEPYKLNRQNQDLTYFQQPVFSLFRLFLSLFGADTLEDCSFFYILQPLV